MDIKNLMKECGIVGAGGAGFPSYAKLADGADTLVVNGSECEPLLYTDYMILKREMPLVLEGVRAVVEYCKISRAFLSVKEHTAKRLSLSDGQLLSYGVRVKVLPNVYPIGDEVSLIYQTTGRVVRPGNLPISSGCVVFNVETMFNLGRAIRYGEGVSRKWLTVGGDIPTPTVVRVPVGTSVSELLCRLGITVDEGHTVIDGGPSMGKIINPEMAVVTRTTKGILILPSDVRAVESKLINESSATARAQTACCQCTRCTDMCPRHLLGYPLEPHKMVRTAMGAATFRPELVKTATLCCGCGICESLACSQGISPRAVISNYKALLGKNKIKYISSTEVFATPEREYRMIPSDRWAATLGVKRFDKDATWGGELDGFERVSIPLGRFIGAPAVPSVKDGDIVDALDNVGISAPGLSVNAVASMSGRVTVGDGAVIIDKI